MVDEAGGCKLNGVLGGGILICGGYGCGIDLAGGYFSPAFGGGGIPVLKGIGKAPGWGGDGPSETDFVVGVGIENGVGPGCIGVSEAVLVVPAATDDTSECVLATKV